MSSRPYRWPFVGREKELTQFNAVIGDRNWQAVFIVGKPGVGKTLLAEHCLKQAEKGGFSVIRACTVVANETLPYTPIAHLLPYGIEKESNIIAATAKLRKLHDDAKALILFIDDLHLIDRASAVFIRHLLNAGVLRLIATAPSQDSRTGSLLEILSHRDDCHHQIYVDLLSRSDVEALLCRIPKFNALPRRTVDNIYDVTGGNPLHLRELLMQATSDMSVADFFRIPIGRHLGDDCYEQSLQSRILRNLDKVEARLYPILQLIALCDSLSLSHAETMVSAEDLVHLEAQGIIHASRDNRRVAIRLAHPLYGEHLRLSITPRQRTEMLLDTARRYEHYGLRRQDDSLRVAIWRLTAEGKADPALLQRAAVVARNGHDYQQVVVLMRAIPPAEMTLNSHLLLGDALFQMGCWEEAETVLQETASLVTSDDEVLSLSLLRTSNLVWSNRPALDALTVNYHTASSVVSNTTLHCLRINEGFLRVIASQPIQGLALLQELEADPRNARDVNTWLRGALVKPVALALTGKTEAAMQLANVAYTFHREVDKDALVSHPEVQRLPLVLALSEAGQLKEAESLIHPIYEGLAEAGAIARVWAAVFAARAQWISGHIAEARAWWEKAAQLSEVIHHYKALRLIVSGLTACAAVQGDPKLASEYASEYNRLPHVEIGILSSGEEAIGQAWLHVTSKELAPARTLLEEGAKIARETGHFASEALLLTELARLGNSTEVQGRLLEISCDFDGRLASARAQFAASLSAKDPHRLHACALELQDIGADLLAVEAAAAAAQIWHRRGETRQATSERRFAYSISTELAHLETPLLYGLKRPPKNLSSRETEIAECAAIGLTSKEIATRLFLSTRTVENHLQRIYSKVGVTSRKELARVLSLR
ncbi:LuxR C-terminal-related transcriptional regulator [Streptomyces djakartensis]|uniref:LuxR C-terminal-related transcriptional regulator n=1 Tax=Streptomyces djakartensis TaxID=68193 RepID=UPI0034DDEAD1